MSDMPKRVPLSVSLTVELAAFVAERVGSGRYGSASEVIRTSLRLLEQKENSPPRRRPRMGIREGVDGR